MPDLYFTQAGDHPDLALERFIGAAQQGDSLRLAIFALNRLGVAAAILGCQTAGADVRVITDFGQAAHDPGQPAILAELAGAGVPIKISHHRGIMHLKMAVLNTAGLALGSFNWTNGASTINDEVLMVVDDPDAATRAAGVFDQMWQSARFVDWSAVGEGRVRAPRYPAF